MAQKRDLQPVTVYLQPEVIRELQAEARYEGTNISAICRRVLLKYVRDSQVQAAGK